MQFTQEGNCLEFTNAFEIPARDAVPMEVHVHVISLLIFIIKKTELLCTTCTVIGR